MQSNSDGRREKNGVMRIDHVGFYLLLLESPRIKRKEGVTQRREYCPQGKDVIRRNRPVRTAVNAGVKSGHVAAQNQASHVGARGLWKP